MEEERQTLTYHKAERKPMWPWIVFAVSSSISLAYVLFFLFARR